MNDYVRLSDDQTTPYSEYVDGIFQSRDRKLVIRSLEKNAIYEKAQVDMLEAGWRKVEVQDASE